MVETALIKKDTPALAGKVLTRQEMRQEIKLRRFLEWQETLRILGGKSIDLLNNPFGHLIVGFTAVEILQKFPSKENPIMPQTAGNVLEGTAVVMAALESSGGLGGLLGLLKGFIK